MNLATFTHNDRIDQNTRIIDLPSIFLSSYRARNQLDWDATQFAEIKNKSLDDIS